MVQNVSSWLLLRLFSSLASDKASALPYNREIADQRRKYGEVMLRKTEDHLAAQEAHEAEVQEKMNAARQRRQEERDRVTVLEVREDFLVWSGAYAFTARESRTPTARSREACR